MKLKYLLIATAVFYLINAFIALLMPAAQLSLYGISSGPGESYMAQWAGLGSLAISLIAFFSRNVTDRKSQWALVLSLLVYWVVGAAISLLGIFSGVMSAMGWSLVVVCLLFAAVYGYFFFRNRSAT